MGKANVTIRHPKSDGGGSALKLDMHYQTDEHESFIRFSFANQSDDGGFDFSDGIVCDLDFNALSELLTVANGGSEAANGGNPIKTGEDIFFAMKHVEEGYCIAACHKRVTGDRRSMIVLKQSEMIGVKSVVESAMFFIAFIKGVNP